MSAGQTQDVFLPHKSGIARKGRLTLYPWDCRTSDGHPIAARMGLIGARDHHSTFRKDCEPAEWEAENGSIPSKRRRTGGKWD